MGSLCHGRRSAVLIVSLLAVFAFSAPALMPAHAEDAKDPGQKTLLSVAPDFTGVGVDGKNYRLTELLKQGPVLIDFWTTWCTPCMLEMPKLQDIWQRHKAQGFTLLGIPSDDQKTTSKVKPKIRQMGFVFPNIPDPTRRIGNAYNVRNFPTTVLIAKDGKIVKMAQGFNPGDEKEWETRIVALLGGAPATEGAK
jgi:peroxiredoxin